MDLHVEAQQAEEWDQFVRNVERNCLRYLKLLYEAIDQMLEALPLPSTSSGAWLCVTCAPRTNMFEIRFIILFYLSLK